MAAKSSPTQVSVWCSEPVWHHSSTSCQSGDQSVCVCVCVCVRVRRGGRGVCVGHAQQSVCEQVHRWWLCEGNVHRCLTQRTLPRLRVRHAHPHHPVFWLALSRLSVRITCEKISNQNKFQLTSEDYPSCGVIYIQNCIKKMTVLEVCFLHVCLYLFIFVLIHLLIYFPI